MSLAYGRAWVDAAINYKSESVLESLNRDCPAGIDVYFDNVGGEILDAALSLINQKARVVLWVDLSIQRDRTCAGSVQLSNILIKRARMEGFIVIDYMNRPRRPWRIWASGSRRQDQISSRCCRGLERAPEALGRLFDGSNVGKLVVQL